MNAWTRFTICELLLFELQIWGTQRQELKGCKLLSCEPLSCELLSCELLSCELQLAFCCCVRLRQMILFVSFQPMSRARSRS